VLAISSPLTTKTAQSFGVAYEPAAQPNRLPDDLARAKAEYDKSQRKTVVTPRGSAIEQGGADDVSQSMKMPVRARSSLSWLDCVSVSLRHQRLAHASRSVATTAT
jgi:hypothetical protein